MAKPKREPDTYSDEEKDEIFAYVVVQVSTGRFVSRVFREDETTDLGLKLPNRVTFWKWVVAGDAVTDNEYSNKLARAREQGVEALLDEVLEIADDGRNDTYMKELDNGREVEVTNVDVIQRSRLRVDTRVKLAQMLKPRTYGPKLDLTSDGEKIGLTQAILAAKERQRRREENGE